MLILTLSNNNHCQKGAPCLTFGLPMSRKKVIVMSHLLKTIVNLLITLLSMGIRIIK